ISLLPVYRYYAVVWQNAINMPFQDDFDSGLRFLTQYSKATTLADKCRLLFSQHAEHRIVLNRAVSLADYALFGQLDLRHMILFGNFALVIVLAILFQTSFSYSRFPKRVFYFLPVPFLLFQINYWELTVWGMGSVQNFYALALSLLSLYALSRAGPGKTWFGMAAAAAIISTFTSGNGILTFVAGIAVLCLNKQYRRLAIWALLGTMTACLYFWGY